MRYIINILLIITSFLLLSCSASKKDSYNDDIIVDSFVEDTSYPGGIVAMNEFFEGNMVYPKEALENKIEGRVFTTFVVEKDGEISDIKILRGLGYGCDEEAIRIIKLMPKWKPAVLLPKKTKVRQQFNLPIIFKLPESEK